MSRRTRGTGKHCVRRCLTQIDRYFSVVLANGQRVNCSRPSRPDMGDVEDVPETSIAKIELIGVLNQSVVLNRI